MEEGLDPKLAERLARQQQKIVTGDDSAIDSARMKSTATSSDYDPKLASRLAKQQEKVQTGQSAIDEAQMKAKGGAANYDPTLAQRFAKQQAKLETGDDSAIANVKSTTDSRSATENYDPKLAERWKKQEALHAGNGKIATPRSDPSKNHLAPTDPVLAARLNRQQEKVQTGENDVERSIAHAPRAYEAVLDPKLAARLAKQQQKVETGKAGFSTPRGELNTTQKEPEHDPLTDLLAAKAAERQKASLPPLPAAPPADASPEPEAKGAKRKAVSQKAASKPVRPDKGKGGCVIS
jgi:hypothetical protein